MLTDATLANVSYLGRGNKHTIGLFAWDKYYLSLSGNVICIRAPPWFYSHANRQSPSFSRTRLW